MIRLLKVIFLFLSIFLCSLVLVLLKCLFMFSPTTRKKIVAYTVHFFGKAFILIMGIKVKISGEKELLRKRGVFFICNHLSYIDGIIANSLSPLVFIGKTEMRKWPFFGIFIFLSNTIFVNRINSSNIHKEVDKIVSFLTSKVNVILFPEGTSTDGKALLPFKSSFFAAPLAAKCKIIPLVIKYKEINHKKLNNENKNLIYWYGDMGFLSHLLNVLKLRRIVVEVNVCEPVHIEKGQNGENHSQRKYLRDICRKTIENQLNLTENAGIK